MSDKKVIVRLKEQSDGIVHENVTNAYTKGYLYCVYVKDNNEVYKYPLLDIFQIRETYS